MGDSTQATFSTNQSTLFYQSKSPQSISQNFKERKRLTKKNNLLLFEQEDKNHLSQIQERESSNSRTQDSSANLVSLYRPKHINQITTPIPIYEPIISEHSSNRDGSGYMHRTEKIQSSLMKQMAGTLISSSNNRQSATIKMLSDREKFTLAKNNYYIDILLDLVQSQDQVGSNSFIESARMNRGSHVFGSKAFDTDNISQMVSYKQNSGNSHYHKNKPKDSVVMSSSNGNAEVKSDLRKAWMLTEELVSHSALNQLSYIVLTYRKELKLSIFYNLQDQCDKLNHLILLRNQLLRHFEDHQTIEKRLQKFLLMADDAGIQASLFLLLVLSDEEMKGNPTLNIEFANMEIANDYKSSIGSQSEYNNDNINKHQSIISSASRKLIKSRARKNNQDKNSKYFKKQTYLLLQSIDYILNDQNVSQNTIRVAILLIGNLFHLNSSMTKQYVRKKPTFSKLLIFFDRERDNMTEMELVEMETTLKKLYTPRECFQLTNRKKQISRLKDVYFQQIEDGDNEQMQVDSKLIRSDSSESLIEMIQNEHLKMMERQDGSVFQITELCDIKDGVNRKILVNSMDPTDMSQSDLKITRRDMVNNQLLSTELGKARIQNRKNTAFEDKHLNPNSPANINLHGIESASNAPFSDKNSPTVQFFKSPTNQANYLNQSTSHALQHSLPQNSVLSHGKVFRDASKDDDGYGSRKNSKYRDTPLDSFLEMRESFFIRDRSFFQGEKGQYVTGVVSTDGNSQVRTPKEGNKKKKPSGKKEDATYEYQQNELKISRSNLKMSSQSTMMNTKMTSKNFQSNYKLTVNPQQSSCCFCISRKSSQNQTMLRTTMPCKDTIIQEQVSQENGNSIVTLNNQSEEGQSERGNARCEGLEKSGINLSGEIDKLPGDMRLLRKSNNQNSMVNQAFMNSEASMEKSPEEKTSVFQDVKVSFGMKSKKSVKSSKKASLSDSQKNSTPNKGEGSSNQNSQGCLLF